MIFVAVGRIIAAKLKPSVAMRTSQNDDKYRRPDGQKVA
jgi:hypothetical protein